MVSHSSGFGERTPTVAQVDGPVAGEGDSGSDAETRPAPKRLGQIARLAFLALTLAAGAYAVAHQWTRVQAGFAELGPVPLVAALGPALASVAAMMLAWRGLLGALGSPLRLRPAARIFFTSQLGKYLPGAVWPMVAQMQLGRAYRIPRTRSAAAAALAMLVSLGSALVLAALTLPLGGGADAAGYRWAFVAVPVLLAGLHPRIANPALKTIFRVTRRPAIEPLTGRTIAETAARSVAGWLLAGAHIWILAVALGATPGRTMLLAVGGYAFAWSVGFIIVFAPAGAGVRELILVAALQPVLDPGKATVVALASRLITIVADLVAAAATAREGKSGAAPDGDAATEPAAATA
jgi:glycosyltransferase 2 family protein